MSTKSVAIVLALAACLLIGSAAASHVLKRENCPGSVLDNLESQIQLCARNVPVEQFNDPRWRSARCVRKALSRAKWGAPCTLDKVPELLGSCLASMYVSQSDIAPAVACMRTALDLGLCC